MYKLSFHDINATNVPIQEQLQYSPFYKKCDSISPNLIFGELLIDEIISLKENSWDFLPS